MDKTIMIMTHEQHPLTGDSEPIFKVVTSHTTIHDILKWYRSTRHGSGMINDLRIVEVD